MAILKTALLFCLMLFGSVSLVQAFEATVLHIHDADTVIVVPRSHLRDRIKVRLYGIDAPELKQRYGQQATQWLRRELPEHTLIEVTPMGKDHYDRTIAVLHRGRTNINEALVRAGQVWVYSKHCKIPECRDWHRAQQHARSERRGLWRDADPTPPWIYRKQMREGRRP